MDGASRGVEIESVIPCILGFAPLIAGAVDMTAGNVDSGFVCLLSGTAMVGLSEKARQTFSSIRQSIEDKHYPPRAGPYMAGLLTTSIPIVSTSLYALSI